LVEITVQNLGIHKVIKINMLEIPIKSTSLNSRVFVYSILISSFERLGIE